MVIISNHLGINSSNSVDVPVTFAPGRARLATSPDSTGSPFTDMTTGMVVVAFFAARVDGMQVPTIAAGLRLTKDAASCGNSYGGGPVHVDDDVLAVDPSKLPKPLLKCAEKDAAVCLRPLG